MFQSPSLRGSGRFLLRRAARAAQQGGFNPLHCGAVVASKACACPWHGGPGVSIPFIAGQWSLRAPPLRSGRGRKVSIPFIAGQWSLPRKEVESRKEAEECFNPLHCGAVVASGWRLVVCDEKEFVSIPFIAGQWSLHAGD